MFKTKLIVHPSTSTPTQTGADLATQYVMTKRFCHLLCQKCLSLCSSLKVYPSSPLQLSLPLLYLPKLSCSFPLTWSCILLHFCVFRSLIAVSLASSSYWAWLFPYFIPVMFVKSKPCCAESFPYHFKNTLKEKYFLTDERANYLLGHTRHLSWLIITFAEFLS